MAAPFAVARNAGVPSLSTMTQGALNVLDEDHDGFLLMVEGGAVDWASHANQPGRTIEEQVDFTRAVDTAIAWVDQNSNWGETLIVVTGDHETGYLWGPGTGADASGMGQWMPIVNNGAGAQPGMQFNSGNHTNALIPLFAKGAGARLLRSSADSVDSVRGDYLDNTDIGKVIIAGMR
jgi:alkaline phosphatase